MNVGTNCGCEIGISMYLVTLNILDIKQLEVEELYEISLQLLTGVVVSKLRGEIYIEYDSFESNHSLFVSIDFSPSRYNFVDGFYLNYSLAVMIPTSSDRVISQKPPLLTLLCRGN